MRRTPVLAATLIAATALSFTACAKGGPTAADEQPGTIPGLQEQAQRNGWANVSNLLADGAVTKEELRVAFDNFAACSKAAGVKLTEPQVNPVDGWRYTYTEDGAITAEGSQATMECQTREFTPIAIGYEVTHESVMDLALMTAVQACLKKKSVSTTGQEKNMEDLVPAKMADEARANKVIDCVSSEAGRLFPDAAITLGF